MDGKLKNVPKRWVPIAGSKALTSAKTTQNCYREVANKTACNVSSTDLVTYQTTITDMLMTPLEFNLCVYLAF